MLTHILPFPVLFPPSYRFGFSIWYYCLSIGQTLSSHRLLVSIISSEMLAVIQIIVLPHEKKIFFFSLSLSAFKILSLFWVFNLLRIMCLGVVFFVFIQFGACLPYLNFKMMFCTKFGKLFNNYMYTELWFLSI